MSRSRAVLLLAAVLFVWNLWGYDVWAPDEPYFAEGAREMVADGKWAVPHVNGTVTTDKPPLFFWLIALLSLPLGEVNSLTARLPSALAALAAVALTLRLGRRMAGERTAVLAGLLLAVSLMFWDKARSVQIDALLCLLVLTGMSAFEAFRSGDANGRRAGLLFWAATALAVLAKGPVGLLLPLGIALVTLAFERSFRSWRRFAPFAGPGLFFLIIGAWMVLATLGGDGGYSVWGAFREHVLDRAVHGMHHAQPWWYYLQVLPVKLLPWSGLLPGAMVLAFRRRDPADRFLLVWALFVVVFFSVSTEKRDLYVLPAFPAFALLMARLAGAVCGWEDEAAGSGDVIHRRWVTAPHGAVGALVLAVGAALPFFADRVDVVPFWMVACTGAVLVLAGASTLWTAIRGRRLATVLAMAAGFSLAYLVMATLVQPALDPVKSARDFSVRMKDATAGTRAAGEEIVAYHLENLPEAFAFFTDGVYTRETNDSGELAAHLRSDTRIFAVADEARLTELPEDVRVRLVVVERARLSRREVVLVHNGLPGP